MAFKPRTEDKGLLLLLLLLLLPLLLLLLLPPLPPLLPLPPLPLPLPPPLAQQASIERLLYVRLWIDSHCIRAHL